MIRSVAAGFFFLFAVVSSASAQNCSVPNTLTNGTNADATQVMANLNAILTCVNSLAAPRSYLAGLTLSTVGSSTSFGVAAGVAADSTDANMMALASAMTKTTATWVAGSGNGSFDGTGAAPSATAGWYHVHLIKNVTTQAVDVLVSLSATSPTLPSGYTLARRIGSMKTNSSFQWIAFVQFGDEFLWVTDFADVAAVSITNATANLVTLGGCPTGVQVEALMHTALNPGASNSNGVLITSPDQSDVAPLSDTGSRNSTIWSYSYLATADISMRTSTAAVLRWRAYATTGDFSIYTYGYIDRRGRDN